MKIYNVSIEEDADDEDDEVKCLTCDGRMYIIAKCVMPQPTQKSSNQLKGVGDKDLPGENSVSRRSLSYFCVRLFCLNDSGQTTKLTTAFE